MVFECVEGFVRISEQTATFVLYITSRVTGDRYPALPGMTNGETG